MSCPVCRLHAAASSKESPILQNYQFEEIDKPIDWLEKEKEKKERDITVP
jgi:hypothetical protein